MTRERENPHQISFLKPEDAYMVHLMRSFLAEASKIYETRTNQHLEDALHIGSPRDAYEFLRVEMEDLEQEQLRTLNLNTKNRILSAPMIYQGSVHTTVIRIGEIFRPAILDNASGLIVAHNHPSGDPTPSPEDAAITREIVKVGQMLDIDVVDHIVIGKGKFVSLKERGLGF